MLSSLTSHQLSAQNLWEEAGCTKFVTPEGKGRVASLEKPAKDLGNIVSKLEAGDVVCISEGSYTGRGDRGVDEIALPVSIIGGWSSDFTMRDPWGAHKTVLTGMHNSKNFETGYRLSINTSKFATRLMEAQNKKTQHQIVVDGIIIDNGPRNYYRGDEDAIVRKGTATNTPTPESGGLNINTGVNATVTVTNVIVMNTAPTLGAFALYPGRSARVTVVNNAAINNTGYGFHLSTSSKASEKSAQAKYLFRQNISLFNEKHDPYATYGGSSIALESEIVYSDISYNVFGFNDYYGVDNAKRGKELTMENNVFVHNAVADYLEFDTKIDLEDIEDEAEYVDSGEGNRTGALPLTVSSEWLSKYARRVVIDRNAAEEEVAAVDSWYNELRSVLGANLVGNSVGTDSDVWLPRMSIDDAMSVIGSVGPLVGISMASTH